MLNHKSTRYKKWIVYAISSLATLIALFFILNYLFPLHTDVSYAKIVLANDSTVLHASLSEDDKWRMRTELHELSPTLREAVLYKEDRYFYYHYGFNIFSIGRALINNLWQVKKTSGASTITMQVVRLLEPRKRTYGAKLIEFFRAIQLENTYSKDEILQLYINLVPYGSNIEGVKAASVLYFGTLPSQLSLSQIVTLTIIPNRPTSLRLGKNNDVIKSERNKWLLRYKNDRIFSDEEITTAMQEPLEAKRLKAPKETPHLAYRLIKENATTATLYTFIDKKIQQKAEDICYNYSKRIEQKRIYNSAVLVLDNQTMEVLAYVGSPDFNNSLHAGQVDGVRAVRSPGSALKPLAYAIGFDEGIITPKTILHDVPTDFDGYAPENFDRKFNGKVSVETALSYSLNIPAVKVVQQVTVPKFIEKLKKAGFKKIIKEEKNLGLSAILGGCGVTLEEMTSLYSSFAQEGTQYNLRYLKSDLKEKKTTIVSPSAAYMITDILTQISRPDLPNNYKNSYHIPTIAWKTGTSYGRRDAWSIGYNKKYTVAVWVGNFSGEGAPDLTGADIATPLLFELFNTLDYNSTNNWFFKPADLKFRFVCPETGMLPSDYCEHTVVDYYIPTISSAQKCEHLKPMFISADEHYSYCPACMPEGGYKTKLYPNLSPDLADYYLSQGITFAAIPPHHPRCTRVEQSNAPKIISPIHRKEYIVDKEEPAELALRCNAHNEVKRVYWYINNEFYKEADATEKLFVKPTEGTMKISCSDDKGRNTDISITIKFQ